MSEPFDHNGSGTLDNVNVMDVAVDCADMSFGNAGTVPIARS